MLLKKLVGEYVMINQFLEYEKNNNLFQLEIEGFKYWQYIRKDIYDDILNKDNKIGQAHTSLRETPYYKRILLKLKQIPNWLLYNPLWNLSEKELLVFNHHRRVKNGEIYDCLYTDELLKVTDKTYYVYEQPILEKHFQPIRTEEIRYLDYSNFKFLLYYRFMKKIELRNFSEDDKKQIKYILFNIENNFDVIINKNKILLSIEKIYMYNKYFRKVYSKIFDKVKPKAIIEVVSYGMDKFVINEIANERGIPTIELQHGTMGEYHIAYNFAEKMNLPTFPDYVFTFGQFWKDTTRFPIKDDRVKVIGWPYFENKVNNNNKNNNYEIQNKKTILFISQGTIGRDLSQMAVNVAKMINPNKYNILYKLHPGEYNRWKQDYPWLIETNIEVIDHNHHDMHYYFSQSNIQVGVYSTALIEGLAYKLKTIIMKMYGYKSMANLYDSGYAHLASNSNEVINFCNIENDEEKPIDDYYWKKNSMENMISEINRIVKFRNKL